MKEKEIKDYFKLYKKFKIDEYLIEINNRKIPVGYDVNKLLGNKKITLQDGCEIISSKQKNKLNPNKINNNLFWEQIFENFPVAAIANNLKSRTKKEINEEIIKSHIGLTGLLPIVEKTIQNNKNVKLLEIGPGYGSLLQYLIENDYLINLDYYAIDLVKKFKWKKLYIGDGKTIPKQIKTKFDIVYSSNVFQHLTPEQRKSYYSQIIPKLKEGGYFVFNMFTIDDDNIKLRVENNKKLFSIKDTKKNYYCSFFGQYTKIEHVKDIKKEFEKYNIKFEIVKKIYNMYSFKITKL